MKVTGFTVEITTQQIANNLLVKATLLDGIFPVATGHIVVDPKQIGKADEVKLFEEAAIRNAFDFLEKFKGKLSQVKSEFEPELSTGASTKTGKKLPADKKPEDWGYMKESKRDGDCVFCGGLIRKGKPQMIRKVEGRFEVAHPACAKESNEE